VRSKRPFTSTTVWRANKTCWKATWRARKRGHCVTFASAWRVSESWHSHRSGSEIVAHKVLMDAPTRAHQLVPRLKINVKFSIQQPGEVQAITRNTRALYMESRQPTLGSWTSGLCEVAEDANKARSADERYTVWTAHSPRLLPASDAGDDFVVHSLTKAIGGFGRTSGRCRRTSGATTVSCSTGRTLAACCRQECMAGVGGRTAIARRPDAADQATHSVSRNFLSNA